MDRRGTWAAASGGFDLAEGESPRFTGRALAALAARPALAEARRGDVVVVAELAKELGFSDIDGRNPPSIRSLAFLLPNFVVPSLKTAPAWMRELIPDVLLPWATFSSGPPPPSASTPDK